MRIKEKNQGVPFIIHPDTGSGGNRLPSVGKTDHDIKNFRHEQAPRPVSFDTDWKISHKPSERIILNGDRPLPDRAGLSAKTKSGPQELNPRPEPGAPRQFPGTITEVHLALTNKCSKGICDCHMKRKGQEQEPLDTNQMKSALAALAGTGVVHVEMDCGESLEREDLFELAAFARENGLIPNLAISCGGLTREIAEKLTVFGQVSQSLDGIAAFYSVADDIDLMRDYGIFPGIRYVVGKHNFYQIEQVFRFAVKKSIREIEFCRVKPGPGAADAYEENKTTYEQNVNLVPLLMKYSQQYSVSAKIECSFFPMLCYSDPSGQWWKAFGAFGCEAGNSLLSISDNGMVSGCSFLKPGKINIFDLQIGLEEIFSKQRKWVFFAPEPCKSCRFLSVCKGGCHAVSRYVKGNMLRPDPDCPFVVDYLQKHPFDRLMAEIRKSSLARGASGNIGAGKG